MLTIETVNVETDSSAQCTKSLHCKNGYGKSQGRKLTKLLDQLLVLVQLLQVFHRHGINAQGLGLLTMLVVTQHTHLWNKLTPDALTQLQTTQPE